MTGGQSKALDQIHAIEKVSVGKLKVLAVAHSGLHNRWLNVDVSLSCDHHEFVTGGLALEPFEQFTLLIPPDFPFSRPDVKVLHSRFAGNPHVQWEHQLCLYQSTATEWDPSDGMFGFLERLDSWLDHASRGQLDPIGMPLHPPVAYTIPGAPRRIVVVRANAPDPAMGLWVGIAHLNRISDMRVDIVGWSPDEHSPIHGIAAAIFLANPLSFEFPSTVRTLLDELSARGVRIERLIAILMTAARRSEDGTPLHVIVGAPMRGIRGGMSRHHVAVWFIESTVADTLRLALRAYLLECQGGDEIGDAALGIVLDWSVKAPVEWCRVMEDRPEIVMRRDHDGAGRWFAGKTVALWGCGAVGGTTAEFLTRFGVKKILLRDNGLVTPGILVRQPFEDSDIGKPKVEVLSNRLRRIRPDLEIDAGATNVLNGPLGAEDFTEGADVLIDTTASASVLAKLELCRWTQNFRRVPVATMVIGHRADSAFMAVANGQHSGGPYDVCRKAKLEILNKPPFNHYAEEFWPIERRNLFQPEPGCSDPTFIGAATDVSVLSGMMLNGLADELAVERSDATAAAHFFSLPHIRLARENISPAVFRWESDRICDDPHSAYQIRIAESAWGEIAAHIAQSARIRGPKVETGGVLFGERDDASRLTWVTEVSGPPSDSEMSEQGFVCGVNGIEKISTEKRHRSRGAVVPIGMWHAHPVSAPLPSETDVRGMATILRTTPSPIARSLLMIVGYTANADPMIGTFEFTRNDIEEMEASALLERTCALQVVPVRRKSQQIGLALSGGGARAIAFHLGCLRALHDRGILQKVQVLSSVSGGSVIGAMYAYIDEPFHQFDQRVVELLRSGLLGSITRRMLSPKVLLNSVLTMLTAGIAAKSTDSLRLTTRSLSRLLGLKRGRIPTAFWGPQPPLTRKTSRTTAFEFALRDGIFGDRKLTDGVRPGLEVVINACELRTGSAFRFGTRESGCWRFGRLENNNLPVAFAVAASAAYPVLLPAIDQKFEFASQQGEKSSARVLLTDGGIFDNLGVTCMEPGRSDAFSSNVYCPDYIIACDAGAGLFSDDSIPYWWPTRMVRAFDSVFRKVQNAAYQRLHSHVASGRLKGFVLSYLGQQDHRLPYHPSNLVPRNQVANYPTDFSPMSDDTIASLAARGEVLTRLLIERYCPEL